MIQDDAKKLLAGLALVVIASGCTQTSDSEVTTTQTQGITIGEFSTFPEDQVVEGSNVQLTMTVRNTGGAVARDVSAEVFNVPFGSEDQAWPGSAPTFFGGTTLQPPDTENGIPATPNTETQSLTTPSFSQEVSVPYTFRAKLDYEYTTTAQTEIVLMDDARFRDQDETISRPSVENTGGPVQVEVRTRSPIVFYSGGNTQPRFCAVIENVGDGTAYLNTASSTNSSSSGLNVVEVTPRAPQFSPSVPASDSNGNAVQLVDGRGVQCFDFTPDAAPDANSQTTIPVTLEVNYGYQKETADSVTVQGRS